MRASSDISGYFALSRMVPNNGGGGEDDTVLIGNGIITEAGSLSAFIARSIGGGLAAAVDLRGK